MFKTHNPKQNMLKMYNKNPNLFKKIGVSRDEISGANVYRLKEILNILKEKIYT